MKRPKKLEEIGNRIRILDKVARSYPIKVDIRPDTQEISLVGPDDWIILTMEEFNQVVEGVRKFLGYHEEGPKSQSLSSLLRSLGRWKEKEIKKFLEKGGLGHEEL